MATVAGSGERGFFGDGGPATEALLNNPEDVFADRHGNLYIADRGNFRVRKVDVSGTITTVAGTDIPLPEDAPPDLTVTSEIVTALFPFVEGGPATEARMFPEAVFVDGFGDLYVADSGYQRIRVVEGSAPQIPEGTRERADFDGSGVVDFPDFLAFAAAFGTTAGQFDLDDSGAVDFNDFIAFAQVFGK